jgi:hypothetical protein
MTRKKSSNRGCVGLLALSGFSFGALACAWSFYLGTARAGEQVSAATGISFYAGWLCGMGLVTLGVLFSVLNTFMRAVGGTVDRFGDGDGVGELEDLLPGNLGGLGGLGGIATAGLLGRFLGNKGQD